MKYNIKGKPVGHYVAIVPDPVETKSEGGIILVEEIDGDKKERAEKSSTTGTVVAIGPTAWRAYDGNDERWEPWANIGDHVWFVRHVGKVVKDKRNTDENGDPVTLFVMQDENIVYNFGPKEEFEATNQTEAA